MFSCSGLCLVPSVALLFIANVIICIFYIHTSVYFQFLQVIANFRNGHTGQLSAITIFLLFAGSLARIFTTIQETGDKLFLIQFLTAFALNCTLMGQVVYYWNVQPLKKNL